MSWHRHLRPFISLHYGYCRWLNARLPALRIEGRRIAVHPQVYRPLENEQYAAEGCGPGMRVLDLGCGSGIIALFAALKGAAVTAVDISPFAVANTRENCVSNGAGSVEVQQSDMFASVHDSFDRIITHPPYLHLQFNRPEEQWSASLRFVPTLFKEAPAHLSPNGQLLLIYPSSRTQWLRDLAEAHGFRLVERKPMPPKRAAIFLDSLAHLQFGWNAALFIFELDRSQPP